MADVHVVPIADAIPHEESRQCWCQPTVEESVYENNVVIHHSADGRELLEDESLPPAMRH